MLYFTEIAREVSMNFQVYLDEELGQQVHQLCQKMHKKRNTIIREALHLYLKSQVKKKWPNSVLAFEGVKDFPSFEAGRKEDLLNTRQEFLY